jgi:hypothetical protein
MYRCKSATASIPKEPRSNSTEDKWYKGRAWRLVSALVRSFNPICQRLLDDGRGGMERCHNPSTLVHHHNSPKQRPDLFASIFDKEGGSNLIALCSHCHTDAEGTVGVWLEGRDFARTFYKKPSF